MMAPPAVTIAVLTYGDYPALARRAIDSVLAHCRRASYRLVVGANAVGTETRDYLKGLKARGAIDRLILSPVNINKCPMMRRMLRGVRTPYVWWFDDDSYVTSADALPERLRVARSAPPYEVIWGEVFGFGAEEHFSGGADVSGYVRRAPWYRGLPLPPDCWVFATGGCWFARTAALRALRWPDRGLVKRADDILLGEAIRQQGWTMGNIGPYGVRVNTETRRGDGEDQETMMKQMAVGAE